MSSFTFKKFEIQQDRCAMKVGTDGVLLGAWADGGKHVLDIGSGTGLISIMMAQRFPKAHVVGIDMDEVACVQARENVEASPFSDRVKIVACRLQDFCSENGEGCFDAIVSNPPFFLNSLKNPDSKRAMARHADSLPFRDLFVGVKRMLASSGRFSAIIPTEALDNFKFEALCSGLFLVRECFVKTVERKQPKRCLVSFSKQRPGCEVSSIECMMNSEGQRTKWYSDIVKDFYL